MIPASLFSPTGIMAAIIVALSISNVVFVKMYGAANERYHEFKARVELAQRLAEEQTELERVRQERILADYGQRWAAALADRPVVRVRDASGGCLSPVPSLSATAPGTAGLQTGSGTSGHLEITLDQCERVANWSIEDAIWIDTVKRLTNDLHGAGK